jgi:hypothetical protein
MWSYPAEEMAPSDTTASLTIANVRRSQWYENQSIRRDRTTARNGAAAARRAQRLSPLALPVPSCYADAVPR